MARKDKPYLPFFVQDFMTDEKLMECSASATGVYIRVMCIMHKSEVYGTILLKQKDKRTTNQINNFCLKLARHLPYDLTEIVSGITELVNEKVLEIEGDFLIQKRMKHDGEVSVSRSLSGKEGGEATQKANRDAKAKSEAKMKKVL